MQIQTAALCSAHAKHQNQGKSVICVLTDFVLV